jgi:glutathione S-transferase
MPCRPQLERNAMKLRYSPTSPYVRKVWITALETGLDGRIERMETNPWDPAGDLPTDNPLGKVPALILDDGSVLFDSPVICEYLDSLHGGRRLLPSSGRERWDALRLQALADGILDASVLLFIETRRRAEAERSAWWQNLQTETIHRSLQALEDSTETLATAPDIGTIALGCALGYLDFRFPELAWRDRAPRLAAWYARFAERPSMRQSTPQDPA